MQRKKRENVNDDVFTNTVYGKLKSDPDEKLRYIKALYEKTGQLRFDLEFSLRWQRCTLRQAWIS